MTTRRNEVIGTLLTIGDEILLGDIADTNARHIALELRGRGFRFDRITTVGDREDEIIPLLWQCIERARFVIVTGGLGPTDDDRTNLAVSEAFGRPLLVHDEYTAWLKNRLAERGRPWTVQIARMATLPEGAVKLGMGMAGFFLEQNGVPCYFLPGVPHEMATLMADLVIPDLERRFPDRLAYIKRVIRVQGIVESEINRRLEGLSSRLHGVQIGYLPQCCENWVTLFAAADTEEEAESRIKDAEEQITPLLGTGNVFGCNDESLEKVIGQLLRKRGAKLAIAESCTGGLVSRRIAAVPGASDYLDRALVTYSNRAKMELLKVPEEMLKEHGAVSEPVARAMAGGARSEAGADVSVAVTGIAGPTGGSPEKPVGTVFIACAADRGCVVEKHLFSGAREGIQESAAQAALALLWRTLSDDSDIHCP